MMINKRIPMRSVHYEWEARLYMDDVSRKDSFDKSFGSTVLERNGNGVASKVRFSVYNPDPDKVLYLAGPFNDWGKCSDKELENFLFTKHDSNFDTLVTDKIEHKDPYLFMIRKNGKTVFLRDPAAVYFDDDGNCVFWDYDEPSAYKKRHASPDTLHRPTIILQTDLPGLVARWFEYDPDSPSLAETDKDLFTYIAECGVLDKIKELGYNTLQFLPISQSIDGDNWKYRYLSPFPFAIHRNWGDPDSFKRLIDECHERGIAVITDIILGHSPFKDYRLFGFDGSDIGIHLWKNNQGQDIFLDDHTPWGTKRFRFSDENVRRYLVESTLHFSTMYQIDGFRIDNVDGILRYGDAGQGDERPHGRQFLRKLIKETYDINPLTLFHLESHYFYGDNAKMLVAPHSSYDRALGATAYNSSRLTYYFHKEYMPKPIEEISTWTFERIKEEKEWGRSNSTIADFHNHDAAAGLMEMRATGSYAYDALILKRPEVKPHAMGKIRVMEAIIAFGCEGRILDLPQTFLLQTGTFEHDSSIHWHLLHEYPDSKKTTLYKKAINELISSQPAFWPENTLYREYINVDEQNKILVIRREDKTQGSKRSWYCVINLSNREHFKYRVGVDYKGKYDVGFDSSRESPVSINKPFGTLYSQQSTNFELFSKEIVFNQISPYQIICVYHDRE
ncbi:MAG: alpha-amylase family glycosyl hydrolase [Nanobdellota archaeon]